MDVVDDLVVLADVGDDAHVEIRLVCVHVRADVLHCECDRLLDFLEVLELFDLVVWELVLGGD